MAKPRMNKEEKAFMERINAFVFATPEVRNGQKYLDRKTFAMLSKETQDRWMNLTITKTR